MVGLRAWTHDGDQKNLVLRENDQIRLRYQFKELKDLSGTRGSFNKGFSLPEHPINNEYFSAIFDVNSTGDFNPKKKVRAIIEEDTIPVFDGILQLTSVLIKDGNVAEYKVRVFDASVNLFRSIGDKLLSDYDWSAYDHNLTTLNAINAFGQVGLFSGDLKYGIQDIAYGLRGDGLNGQPSNIYDTARPIHWTSFHPYIRFWAALKIVASQEGFTLISDWWEGTFARKQYLLNYDPTLKPTIPSRDFYFKAYNDGNVSGNGTINNSDWQIMDWRALGTSSNGNIFVDDKAILQDTPLGGIGFDAPILSPSDNLSYLINYSVNFVAFSPLGDITGYTWELQMCEELNGVITVIDSVTFEDLTPPFSSATESGTLGSANPYYGGGNIFLRARSNSSQDVFLFGGLNLQTWWEIDEFVVGSEPIYKVGDYWGNIKAKDIFKTATIMYNLVWVPRDNDSSIIDVDTYNDYINDGEVKEWCIDKEKFYEIKPLTSEESAEINFKFSKADDIFNDVHFSETGEIYGTKKILNDENDFVAGNNNETSPSVPTPLNAIPGTEIMIPKLMDKSGNPVKASIRVLYDGGEFTTVNPIRIQNIDNQFVDLNNYNHFGHFSKPIPDNASGDFDINFGSQTPFHSIEQMPVKNLFEMFWKQTIQTIYDPRSSRLSAHIILNIRDIAQFKWNDQIYIPSLNSYWRVETLDYTVSKDESVRVTLLKLDENTNFNIEPFGISGYGSNNEVSFENEDGSPIVATRRMCESVGGVYKSGVCYITNRKDRFQLTPVSTTKDPEGKLLNEKSTTSVTTSGDTENDWLDLVRGWSSEPILEATIASGRVFRYNYSNGDIYYRHISNDGSEDAFYQSYISGSETLVGFITKRRLT